MPPMGPQGGKGDFKKPKNAKRTFGRILKYMGRSKVLLLLVFIMLVLTTVCSIGASYCLKPILDGTQGRNIQNAGHSGSCFKPRTACITVYRRGIIQLRSKQNYG